MHSAAAFLQVFFLALSSVFVLVDPIAAVPVFLIMTANHDVQHRARMARRAATTCFVVLCGFALAGGIIFRLYGISIAAFQIAGGLILLIIGLDMVQARPTATKVAPGEVEEGAAKTDVGIVPLGIPMLAGPGAISNVMVLIGQSSQWWQTLPVFLAVAVTAAAAYVVLAGADRVSRFMSATTRHILTRIMGIILTAIAIQFFANGLAGFGFLPAHH